jgi:hypothetical protein
MRFSRLVLLLFLVAQFWDGIFTWVAVDVHGVSAEGNVLLATSMAAVGPGATLITAKLGAAAGGIFLYVRGAHAVLASLTALYALAAIGPWLAHFGAL